MLPGEITGTGAVTIRGMPSERIVRRKGFLPNQGVKPLAQFAEQVAGGYKPFEKI